MMTTTNCSILLKAISFAANKHSHQRRKDEASTPYINHPISVTLIISEVGGVNDQDVLAAALLHDTIEDTDTSADELEVLFGRKVRRLVEEVTDDKTLAKDTRKQNQIAHAAKLSPAAVMIKLADKISNIRDVTNSPPVDWSADRRQEYLDWTEKVINNCPKVNPAMEQLFSEVLATGRAKLLVG